ncbi:MULTISPECIES: methylated-DNA--[protein]-cysteine S-methyltransferase [Methanocalculus]|uniref:methylated-DNA--[protein]-cysteine S-methyltransferase n=1 Tax=Methanocalculus TaxID=71151 RepID=UPI0025E645B9|nr:methylated-DNA--[protein]-cysteine S-methyltransferase [Methanocalculus sp. MSAO_Arc1]MCP1661914.1 methylated-DNA-[protein]-cysteine S-methyltransferase [Methanocalculus sp. AMF5]
MSEGTGRFGLWPVSAVWDGSCCLRIWFGKSDADSPLHPELTEYLAGKRQSFSLFRSPAEEGDSVSARIYRVVAAIPYGETQTYAEVAAAAGTHPRAVGAALRRNPTPIIIPCHRVVGKHGIGGFTPDIRIKEDLLKLESAAVKQKTVINRRNKL